MRTQSKLATLVLGALAGLAGCNQHVDSYNKGKVDGYDAIAFVDGGGRRLTILAGKEYDNGRLTAYDGNNDVRFVEISLTDLPRGHPLEAYASLDKLEQVYTNIVTKQ